MVYLGRENTFSNFPMVTGWDLWILLVCLWFKVKNVGGILLHNNQMQINKPSMKELCVWVICPGPMLQASLFCTHLLFYFGGDGSGPDNSIIARFDSVTRKWYHLGNLLAGRYGHAAIFEGNHFIYHFIISAFSKQRNYVSFVSQPRVHVSKRLNFCFHDINIDWEFTR